MKLLLASGNQKKLGELEALLAPLGIDLATPADVGGIPDVVEDRDTFEGNAAKKAESAARATDLWCLADDSGLEVDALNGAPGVRSARFAGEPSNDANNNAKLLRELDGLADYRRGARFVCVLALANPSAEVVTEIRGEAHGRILTSARGDAGFGYDPLFLFDEDGAPGRGSTFAELSAEQKSAISHRGRALSELARRLPALLEA